MLSIYISATHFKNIRISFTIMETNYYINTNPTVWKLHQQNKFPTTSDELSKRVTRRCKKLRLTEAYVARLLSDVSPPEA